MAITVDDLPYVRGWAGLKDSELVPAAEETNQKLLGAFQAHHVPVTGFVIETSVKSLGPTAGRRILTDWTKRGFDLGNHTYSHPNSVSLPRRSSKIRMFAAKLPSAR